MKDMWTPKDGGRAGRVKRSRDYWKYTHVP